MKLGLSKKQAKRLAVAGFGMVASFGIAAVTLTVLLAGEAETVPEIRSLSVAQETEREPGSLRVMSLNLAHGRSNGRNQALQRTSSIRRNLDAVAALLRETQPDVIALQEADGPSFWSGRFDHGAYLGRESSYGYLLPGSHVKGGMLDYGAAILSRPKLSDPASFTFRPTPPTFSKGFVVATVKWPGTELEVDLVSVHLDFWRKTNRRRQVDKMIQKLSQRNRPLIVMGDFNCEWEDEDSSVRRLAKTLDMHTAKNDQDLPTTFRSTKHRLDWILVSREFDIESYEVLPDVVSDHQPVMAVLNLHRED